MKISSPKRSVSVRVDSTLDRNLKEAAAEKGVSVSKLIGEAAEEFLADKLRRSEPRSRASRDARRRSRGA